MDVRNICHILIYNCEHAIGRLDDGHQDIIFLRIARDFYQV